MDKKLIYDSIYSNLAFRVNEDNPPMDCRLMIWATEHVGLEIRLISRGGSISVNGLIGKSEAKDIIEALNALEPGDF